MTPYVRGLWALPRPVFYLGAVWFVVLAAAIAFGPSRVPHVDFDAFYCAGDALVRGADPYRDAPLNDCEQRIHSRGPAAGGTTVPAPLPPYALGPYALLARIPNEVAYALFTCVSVAGLLTSMVLLSRWTETSMFLALAGIGSTAYDDLLKGQPIPIVLLAIVLTGVGLRCGRPRVAAGAAAFTMLEPHIGLPLCAALFLWERRTRGTLLAAAFVLGAVAFLTVPSQVVLPYLTTVLPMQAASEATWATQLSLTSVLALFGVPTQWALTIGLVEYVLASLIGIGAARIVAIRLEAPEAVAFLPPLFAVIGGTYLHNSLLLVAIPACLLVVQHHSRATAYAALAAVAAYWIAIADPINFLVIVVSTYTIAYASRRSVEVSLLCAAAVAMAGVAYTYHQPVFGTPAFATAVGGGYAEESWARFVRAANPDIEGQRLALFIKLPTWAGLLYVSSLAMTTLQRREKLVPNCVRRVVAAAAGRHSEGELLPAAVGKERS